MNRLLFRYSLLYYHHYYDQCYRHDRTGRGGASRDVVGMEDTAALLLGLIGDDRLGAKSEIDMNSDADLENSVRKIFNRLDVDGDGSISWYYMILCVSVYAICANFSPYEYVYIYMYM